MEGVGNALTTTGMSQAVSMSDVQGATLLFSAIEQEWHMSA